MMTTPTAIFCGLTTKKNYPIALKSVEIESNVNGLAVGISAKLTYENTTDEIHDCQFVLPFQDYQTLFHFTVQFPDNASLNVKTRCQKTAKNTHLWFDNAPGSVKIARLLIGRLKPFQKVKVIVGFIKQLKRDQFNNSFMFKLPEFLTPQRHFAVSEPNIVRQLRLPTIAVTDVHYEFKFRAKISLGNHSPIANVDAFPEQLEIRYGDGNNSATISGLRQPYSPNQDFAIRISPQLPIKRAFVCVEKGGKLFSDNDGNALLAKGDLAMVWLWPRLEKTFTSMETTVDWKIHGEKVVAKFPRKFRPTKKFKDTPIVQFVHLKRDVLPTLRNRLPKAIVATGTVDLTTTIGNEEFVVTLPFNIPKKTPSDSILPLHRLAALKKIESYESKLGEIMSRNRNPFTKAVLDKMEERLVRKIVDLSLKSGIPSASTRLVAVNAIGQTSNAPNGEQKAFELLSFMTQ